MPSSFLPKISINKFLIVVFLAMAVFVTAKRNWLNSKDPIQMDANGYYIYLPAIFIYHDLANLNFVNSLPEQFDRKYFLYPTATGGFLTKYSPGIALLESPFFGIAHFLAPVFNHDQSGYSPPYRLAVALSTLFYTFSGLWLLSKILSKYFDPDVVFIVVGLMFFGTNILFYSVLQAGISHNYIFFTLAFSVFFAEKWLTSENWMHFGLAGAGIGLSTLIRPTEALLTLILFGFLWAKWWKNGISLAEIWKDWSSMIAAAIGFLLFLMPLFCYWKFATGNWITYTYEQEGFYFDRPWTIWYGLFGFRKGWFTYTPILFLCLPGFYFLWKDKRLKHIKSALIWYLPFNIFIIMSWYCWWYGGCFGMRALIPALILMAFPLALVYQKFKQKRLVFSLILTFGLVCSFLNIFQSYQYQKQILHMDGMTWQAYKFIFGKFRLNEEEKAELKKLVEIPDYLERGKKLNEYFK